MVDRFDVNDKALPQTKIETEAQAQNFVLELIQEMLKYREECNTIYPDEGREQTVVRQRRAFWVFLTKQGQAIGALKAFLLAGMISERCFTELNQTAINTLIPTVVGKT